MSTTDQHLKRIHDKLHLLLKGHNAMVKENKKLKDELNSANKRLSDQQQSAEELKQQVSILKVSAGDMNDADKKEFEKRINSYLKAIDRCIALLGK